MRFLNCYPLQISKVSPTILELGQDGEDNNAGDVVNGICCSSMPTNGQDFHFTLHLKQQFSVAQQSQSCPDVCPCSSRECSPYILLDWTLFLRNKEVSTLPERPSSERMSNRLMNCRLMNYVQTFWEAQTFAISVCWRNRNRDCGLSAFQSNSWCCMRVLYFTWLTAKSMASLTFEVSIQHLWKNL